MKSWKNAIVLITVALLMFSCFACGKTSKFKYSDQIDRPEMDAPITRPQVVYPEYPATKPAAPAPGAVPSVSGYSASKAENPYELTSEEDGLKVEYADITDYAYVYAPVENYSPEYGNIKITLENSEKPAAERVGIQAIYYEAKELGYSPVTVFIGDLVEGEQYLVSELGDYCITDNVYQAISDQKVRDKTIIGFVIFIDSLPSYAPQADTIGSCKIKSFEFLRDDDPKLQDRYVVPETDLSNANADTDITVTAGEKLTLTANSAGTVRLPISRYSADFGKFTITASGTGNVELGVAYKLSGEKNERLSEAKSITLTENSEVFEYDFSDQRVKDASDDIKTQFVKGGKVTDVYIKLPAGASVEIEKIEFIRTVSNGAYATEIWKGCAGVEVSNVVVGGNAKLAVEHYTGWMFSTLAVRKGDGVQKIVYRIYAPQGLNHIGIAISTTSALGTDGQNAGSYVLRNAVARVDGQNSVPSDSFTAANNLEGVTETIEYDVASKTYVFTYDFTAMKKDANGKTFANYTINSLLFYLNDPNSADVYDGVRNLYFLGIDLLTE